MILSPGLELDALIAEYVYRHTKSWASWQIRTQRWGSEITDHNIKVMQCGGNNYSGDMSLAFEIINKLASDGYQIRISNKAFDNNYWWVYLDSPDGKNSASQGESIPHALCLAIVKLYQVDTEDKV